MDTESFGKIYDGLSEDARQYLGYLRDEFDEDMTGWMDKLILQAATDDGAYGYDGDGDTPCQYCGIHADEFYDPATQSQPEWRYLPEWFDGVKGVDVGHYTGDGLSPVLVWLREDQKRAIDALSKKGLAPIDFMRGSVDAMLSKISDAWR